MYMNQIDQVRELVCAPKYLEEGESFKEGMSRIADALKDSPEHFKTCQEILLDRRFLPGGRVQASMGAARETTAFNCYVSPTILDSMEGIMDALAKAAETMRLGGGDGFDFSTLRPKGAMIKSLGSHSSGPISFMGIWDAMCETIKSAGHRRGAMMGCLRIDHPDVEEFITCKQKAGFLTNFNISVLVTDKFMHAVKNDLEFDLEFDGVVYKTVRAVYLWNKIMRNTWDHAEPGVLFIDTINRKNNLQYCEVISATNPCGEQPLPPNGACLLGSFNLTRYVHMNNMDDILDGTTDVDVYFDYEQFEKDIPPIVQMMDNIIDRTIYPLEEQKIEAQNKRRMGLGITGLANAAEFLGLPYGSPEMLEFTEKVLSVLRDRCYKSSIELAKMKGSFPYLEREKFIRSEFAKTLPEEIREEILTFGIRNSHLLSIAPTGTISLWAGNISSGIEPVFNHSYNRRVIMPGVEGHVKEFYIEDYAYSEWGIKGKTSDEVSAKEHIDVLCLASNYVDSACSKTCNVGSEVDFDQFKDLYMMAYDGGASGCTTFRPDGFREGVLVTTEVKEGDGAACFIDFETGERVCAD